MLSHLDVSDLLNSPRRDVLSIALDVDPTKPENQAEPPAYRIWLRNELRALLDQLPKDERKRIKEIIGRVEAFIEQERPQGRGLAIFAADDLWRVHVLPVPLRNLVRFGRPDVLPLADLGLIEFMNGEQSLTRELTAVPTPGHTPGHMSILITSKGERALVLGDAEEVEARLARRSGAAPLVSANGRLVFFSLGALAEELRRRYGAAAWEAKRRELLHPLVLDGMALPGAPRGLGETPVPTPRSRDLRPDVTPHRPDGPAAGARSWPGMR